MKRTLARLLSTATLLLAFYSPAHAQNATWLLNPPSASGNFNTAANWIPATVPTGTAFFGTSNVTALTFSANTSVGGWTFNAGASAYTFANNQSLVFLGAGIVINGGSASIINSGDLHFLGTSTAGSATITSNNDLNFLGTSTAGNAAITNNNNSGTVVDFSGSTGPTGDNKLTAGSIGGAGVFQLGANELTVGGNNFSTEVSGAIVGTGSLVKVGTGTLTLSGNANLGGTTIDGGTLAV